MEVSLIIAFGRASLPVLGVDWGAFDLGVFVAGFRLYHKQLKLGICEDGKSIPCSRPDNAWRGDGLVGTTGSVCRHAVCGRSVCVYKAGCVGVFRRR